MKAPVKGYSRWCGRCGRWCRRCSSCRSIGPPATFCTPWGGTDAARRCGSLGRSCAARCGRNHHRPPRGRADRTRHRGRRHARMARRALRRPFAPRSAQRSRCLPSAALLPSAPPAIRSRSSRVRSRWARWWRSAIPHTLARRERSHRRGVLRLAAYRPVLPGALLRCASRGARPGHTRPVPGGPPPRCTWARSGPASCLPSLPSLRNLVVFRVFVAMHLIRVDLEERALQAAFPIEYDRFAERAPRIAPWPTRELRKTTHLIRETSKKLITNE